MRTHPLVGAVVVGALALALPGAAQAASAADPSFTVRGTLTSKTELRGTVSFSQPSGWKKTAGGNRHLFVMHRIVQGECTLDLSASMRGKATRQSVRAQVSGSAGDAPLGSGTRPGGAWGTDGPTIAGGEPLLTGIYGIAPIRVAANRYGQLRVMGSVRGCDGDSADAKSLLDPQGTTVGQINRILKTAKTSLRVARVN